MAPLPETNNTFGIQGVNNISIDNLTAIGNNLTDPIQFFSNVNEVVYTGLLFFVLMWVLVAIIYLALQQFKNQPLVNAMYACTLTSIIGFLLRTIEVTGINGTTVSLITDNQMWVFPILAIVLAAIVKAISD